MHVQAVFSGLIPYHCHLEGEQPQISRWLSHLHPLQSQKFLLNAALWPSWHPLMLPLWQHAPWDHWVHQKLNFQMYCTYTPHPITLQLGSWLYPLQTYWPLSLIWCTTLPMAHLLVIHPLCLIVSLPQTSLLKTSFLS